MPGLEGKNPSAGRMMVEEPRAAEFSLRPAKPRDYWFALALHLDSARRYLSKIGRWDRRRIGSKFRHGYKQAQARVICIDGKAIGWIQVAELAGRLHLRQLHLVPAHRGNGIGTRLIKDLFRRAAALGKPVTLEVLHGNPARSLYLRLGFRQAGRDADKSQMIWRPPPR
jgi:ribosomal protein S18 acetylase RimI-like enzyme